MVNLISSELSFFSELRARRQFRSLPLRFPGKIVYIKTADKLLDNPKSPHCRVTEMIKPNKN
jgi:hypothetical protein